MKGKLLLLPLLLLSSCQKEETRKVNLLTCPVSFEKDGDRQYQAWNCKDALSEMIASKASFALFVYVPGCSTCQTFTYFVDAFLAETNALLPYCLYGDYTEATDSRLENSSLLIYQDGLCVDSFDFVNSSNSFSAFVSDHVEVLPIDFLSVYTNPNDTAAFYPSFSIQRRVTATAEDTLPSTPFLDISEENRKNILFVRDDLVSDYTDFFSSLSTLSFSGVAVIDGDIDNLDAISFVETYGFEKGEAQYGFTYVDYTADKIFSASSLLELSELVDLFQ